MIVLVSLIVLLRRLLVLFFVEKDKCVDIFDSYIIHVLYLQVVIPVLLWHLVNSTVKKATRASM